jgi:GxxExxY protein
MGLNEISGAVVDAAVEVHRCLGPGLLEEVYKQCLYTEMTSRGLKAVREVGMPIVYKNLDIEVGYRIDILVEDCVILELKAVAEIAPVHKAQLLTYLKLSRKPLGLLLNFYAPLMKQGIFRIAYHPL